MKGWIEFLIYLWFKRRQNKSKINKIINKLRILIDNYDGPEELSGILKSIEPFTILLDQFPYDKLMEEQHLFTNLDDNEIDRVYKNHLPDVFTLQGVNELINTLSIIVKTWENEAELLPFGSIVNGFMLKGNSDIDLTILIPSKMSEHPLTYSHSLINLL